MPKKEWGVKRVCPTTGKRFYDLNKDPIVSPYTREVVTLDANTRTRVAIEEKPEVKAKEEDLVLADETDLLEEDAAEAEIDDDLLEDDDEDDVPLEEIADVAAPGEDD